MKDIVCYIKKYNNFLIIGHKEPDFDCVGSALALHSFLKRIGKTSILLNEGPFLRKEVIPFENQFLSTPDKIDTINESYYAVILVDCSTRERIGDKFELFIRKMPIGIIDHHSSGEKFNAVTCINPSAPSTTYLVEKLIKEFGYDTTKEEAWYILVGFCTDTGFFKFLNSSDPSPFEMVARLVSKGIIIKDIVEYIESTKSLKLIETLKIMLNNLESYFGNKVLITILPFDPFSDKDIGGSVNEIFYSLLSNIENNEVLIVMKEKENGSIVVGLRSKKHFDVGSLAESFGGGGHKNASGFRVDTSSLKILKDKILSIITKTKI